MLTDLCPFTRLQADRVAVPPDTCDRFAFFSSLQTASVDWDAAAPPDDVFLSRAYLAALEDSPPPGLRLGYLVFYHGDVPAGVALLQWMRFDGRAQLRYWDEKAKNSDPWARLWAQGRRIMASCISGEVLVCGNLLMTGGHGFYFSPKYLSVEKATALLLSALEAMAQGTYPRVSATLVKDVHPACNAEREGLAQAEYAAFSIQPNMTLALPYRSWEDYLAAMVTKYRTRAKRAFKKAADLERRRLSLFEIQQALPRLHALYASVAQHSGFHWVTLNETYLLALQRYLGERFHLIGWYRDNQLVGFHTAIENGTELEAHFLGYEDAANTAHQLYLNMLYDLVRMGIERGCSRVVFGRTALEIKSSIGAQPQDLPIYLRLQSPLWRRFCHPLLRYLNPAEPWVPRHPFKHAQPQPCGQLLGCEVGAAEDANSKLGAH